MTVRVLVGDALSVLRSLPAESVQCVVTSPPYFGLRAYGTDPQVWGGDPEHSPHEWAEYVRKGQTGGDGSASGLNCKRAADGTFANDSHSHGADKLFSESRSAFCPCGAWRGELGSEPTPALFIEHLVSIFDEVKRVLRPDGLCFVNLGDSYSGSGKGSPGPNALIDHTKRQGFVGRAGGREAREGTAVYLKTGDQGGIPAKNLLLIPQRFAIAMQERGWIVRKEIAWCKRASMPESVRDRPSSAWEPVWMFAKSAKYFYDQDAVREKHSPQTTDTGQRRRMIAAGKFSTEDEYAGRATGQRGGVGERMLKLNGAGANLRDFWLVDDVPSTPEQQMAQFLSFAEDHLGERAFGDLIEAFNEGMDGAPDSEYWLLGPSPFADAHFATFPPEIPRRCILAGTSEKGACPACGAPWRRVSESETTYTRNSPDRSAATREHFNGRGSGGNPNVNRRPVVTTTTLGWQPGCSCDAGPPIPQTVLDPFGGSGTTGLVADRLGRDAVLVELNPEYAEMARKRIEQDAGNLFGDPVSVEAPAQQIDLFGEVS